MRIFEPAESGTRKVILSTNIAEVSVGCEWSRYSLIEKFQYRLV